MVGKQSFLSCIFCLCICRSLKKVYRVHPNRKVSTTFNSSKSAEVHNREHSTFMNQVHISQQNSIIPSSLLAKGRTLPADSTHYKSLLSRHEELDYDGEKAKDYDDVGGVLILRKLRVTEDAQETDEPRRHTL